MPQATLGDSGLHIGTLSPELNCFGLLLCTLELITADTEDFSFYQRKRGHWSSHALNVARTETLKLRTKCLCHRHLFYEFL